MALEFLKFFFFADMYDYVYISCKNNIIPSYHYANMSVQYSAIFHGCKIGNFRMKNCDIFLIFAQNIDRGYTLEPPQ